MICILCEEYKSDKELELSHDIPKYMGGIDSNGRRYLCKECHDKYERAILSRCFISIFKELLPSPKKREDLIQPMMRIKNSSEVIKKECRIIAYKCKQEFFRDDTPTT